MASDGFRNYYKILGLDRLADENLIKKSFRQLARKYHPDINPGNKKAEEKFKEITEAYEVLSDSEKRKKYDNYGKYWSQGDGVGEGYESSKGQDLNFTEYGNFDDFIDELLGRFKNYSKQNYSPQNTANFDFRSPKKPNLDLEIDLIISFFEAFKGTERSLAINNERVKVKIPAGIKTGAKLRIKGKGNLQPGKGRRGDLYLRVNVKPHKIWTLDGDDVRADFPLSLDEIALGAKLRINTLESEAQIVIPPKSKPGQNLRLVGKGWPTNNGFGDLILTIEIAYPSKWSDAEIEQLNKLRISRNFDPRENWNYSSTS